MFMYISIHSLFHVFTEDGRWSAAEIFVNN